MKKIQPTGGSDEPPDLNYKQLAKVKYLTQQCRELAALRSLLEDVSHRSKLLLQLTSTQRSSSEKEGELARQMKEMRELLISTRDGLEQKRDALDRSIIQADRNKKEDQLLYRRILQSYEQKISELKDTVLNRQAFIQQLEKDRRENKKVVLDKKLLICSQSNVVSYFRLKSEMDVIRKLARQNLELKLELNSQIHEIHKLENVLTKLKMARETKMPFYRFRDIMRNGIERMSDNDKNEYEFLVGQAHRNRELQNGDILQKDSISSENLYLMLKKEELNGIYLREMIAEQTKKQEAYQQNNAKFKEAIRQIEEQQMCREIGSKIRQHLEEFSQSKWESMSQKPGSRRKLREQMGCIVPACSSEQYRMYLNNMAHSLKGFVSELFFLRMKRVAKRSRSHEHKIRLWPERENVGPSEQLYKESFYEKCNNFITERFYEDIEDVSY